MTEQIQYQYEQAVAEANDVQHGHSDQHGAEAYAQPDGGRLLAPDELYQEPGFAEEPVDAEAATRIPIGGNQTVNGELRSVVRMGGAETYADIQIIDTRSNPIVRMGRLPDGTEYPVRHVGQHTDGRNLNLAGDYIVVIPSTDGRPPVTRALMPGMPLRIGRGEGMVGGYEGSDERLPDTVSHEHAEIRLSEHGTLQVKNLNPTNETRVFSADRSAHDATGAQAHDIESRQKTSETLSDDEAAKLLSYSDVLEDTDFEFRGNRYSHPDRTEAIERVKNSPSGQKYMAELKSMVETHGAFNVRHLAADLRDEGLARMRELKITPSKYGESISWAMWDLAKQSYLAKHPEESAPEYANEAETALVDPMRDDEAGDRKRNEIINRHVGWEIARSFDAAGRPGQLRSASQIDKRVFPSAFAQLYGAADPNAMQWLLEHGARNETGQHRSHVLHQIGAQATRRLVEMQRAA